MLLFLSARWSPAVGWRIRLTAIPRRPFKPLIVSISTPIDPLKRISWRSSASKTAFKLVICLVGNELNLEYGRFLTSRTHHLQPRLVYTIEYHTLCYTVVRILLLDHRTETMSILFSSNTSQFFSNVQHFNVNFLIAQLWATVGALGMVPQTMKHCECRRVGDREHSCTSYQSAINDGVSHVPWCI